MAAGCLLAAALLGGPTWGTTARATTPPAGTPTLAAVAALNPSPNPYVYTPAPWFTDVAGDEWFAEAVRALAAKGIVQPQPDGSFGPNEPVTRAELAFYLSRALGLEESPGQPFFDVNRSDWFAGAVGALFQKRLIQGTSMLMFSPHQPVTRQQAITLVMKSLGFFLTTGPAGPAIDLELEKADIQAWLAGFCDRGMIASDHKMAAANACRLGIVGGFYGGWLFPECNLTRVEAASMIHRAFLKPIWISSSPPGEQPVVDSYEPQAAGDEGSLVYFLQNRLTVLGYPCGPADGVYDHRTRDAVMAFQKVEKLKRDGRVGAEVWQRLLSAHTPAPRLTAPGTRCEVDLTRQVLFMITDDKVWKVVHVSTGKLGTRTGSFAIGAKYRGWVKCVTLPGEMYYPSYVVSKTAIHGYRSVPPYPASHGCVRTPVWLTEELYEQLPTGTPVDIFY